MKKLLLVTLLAIFPPSVYPFAFDNSVLILRCPGRETMEVILHRYEHTQEAWGRDHFETGGGHRQRGSLVIFPFANLDSMVYDQITQSFGFWYQREARFVHCRLLSLRNAWPVDLPVFRE